MAGRINIQQWFDLWPAPATAAVEMKDCVVCWHWPEADRSVYREMINTMPLQDDVCIECQMAFWRHMGVLDLFTGRPPKH